MSGKAYTMKEMKAIVDYLKENRAFGEIRGRKMWVEFENTKLTDRTWQSLKETFLKRILPDIHNPYYQLTLMQISSFRQGYDVQAKLNNKLEIRTVSEGSSTEAAQPEITEQPSSSNNKDGEEKSGEEQINSKSVTHHRSSADTIILDTCYETAEEIQRDLESPKQDKNNVEVKSPKTIRDFITYSEPLTPMLQEVIDDFATDEEHGNSDDEPQMEIAEDVEICKDPKTSNDNVDDLVEISSGSEDVSNNVESCEVLKESCEKEIIKKDTNSEKSASVEKTTDKQSDISTKQASASEVTKTIENSHNKTNIEKSEEKDLNKVIPEEQTENSLKMNTQESAQKTTFSQNSCTQNFSHNSDSMLPNNQEAYGKKSNTLNSDSAKDLKTNGTSESTKKRTRKRANSQEPTFAKQKKTSLALKTISMSDTDSTNKQGENLKAFNKEQLLIACDKKVNKNDNVSNNCKEKEIHDEIMEDVNNGIQNEDINLNVENPCLKSVSLYNEQFSSMKYSDSSDGARKKTVHKKTSATVHKENEQDDLEKATEKEKRATAEIDSTPKEPATSANKKTATTKQDSLEKNVVVLQSHSDDNKTSGTKKATPMGNVLTNLFGFNSGGAISSRKKRVSYKKRTQHQSFTKGSSGSSEWTSESDAEFVSPPRGRRNRHARKYLKPKPARILSLEEEGGLFVMYGKKIYPVVKDGKLLKNVTYAPENDSEDEEESFWKLKYLEEKKRTAQLTKLLNQTSHDDNDPTERAVSVDESPSLKRRKLVKNENALEEKANVEEVAVKTSVETPKTASNEDKTLKIKITKLNEEVQLEGHWSQIHPVLDHVVQIFHKEVETKPSLMPAVAPTRKASSSGRSSPVIIVPVDSEVHEKVNKLETEIFQEIEALDKEDVTHAPKSLALPALELQANKRKPGRPKKSVTPKSSKSPLSENSMTKQQEEPEKSIVHENVETVALTEIENGTSPKTRRKTPRKILHENTETNESSFISTRPKRTKEPSVVQPEDEGEVRYKFPSPPPSRKTYRRSGSNKTAKEQRSNKSVKQTLGVFPSPDSVSMNSIESSQGYQDSDVSPTLNLRKKKRYTITHYGRGKYNSRTSLRRRTQWQHYLSDQSSNSYIEHENKLSLQKSCSDIYRSDSYQLLMPQLKNVLTTLAKIEEVNSADQVSSDIQMQVNNMNPSSTDKIESSRPPHKGQSRVGDITDVDNSSNVSLPPSPVLSIVENITINNEVLDNTPDNVREENCQINDAQCAGDFQLTNVDVSMPLMQQDNGLKTNDKCAEKPQYDVKNLPPVITESFINKICTVNIEDNPTLSETINQKLRNLLLESAKKMAKKSNVNNVNEQMEIDSTSDVAPNKSKTKKRCSTPLKRTRGAKKKSKKPEEVVIEEQRTESCSLAGRKSCPPFIQVSTELNSITDPNKATGAKKRNSNKGRKKKENIIKVKIVRPKSRRDSKESHIGSTNPKDSEKSVHGDSGINDTISSTLLHLNDSIDLIHNHSETCLRANECIGDSIEFVENCTSSVITIDTNSDHSIDNEKDCLTNNDSGQFKLGIYNSDGDAKYLRNAFETVRSKHLEGFDFGAYHTPMNSEHSLTSLITEDLSDPDPDTNRSRPTKWYLFSEDDTNTNSQMPANFNVSYGSDLNQLFPIACAVPDLSTITEMSNDKPPSSERTTCNDIYSQSIFDSNF